ncbi:acyl carrier protein [bacterium]|nr:acyl carrier protein [bacterium]
MIEKTDIRKLITDVVSETTEQMGIDFEISDGESPLYGKTTPINSIVLVNIIVAVEDELNTRYNKSIIIASEKAFSRKLSPFRTIESLVDYTTELMQET